MGTAIPHTAGPAASGRVPPMAAVRAIVIAVTTAALRAGRLAGCRVITAIFVEAVAAAPDTAPGVLIPDPPIAAAMEEIPATSTTAAVAVWAAGSAVGAVPAAAPGAMGSRRTVFAAATGVLPLSVRGIA